MSETVDTVAFVGIVWCSCRVPSYNLLIRYACVHLIIQTYISREFLVEDRVGKTAYIMSNIRFLGVPCFAFATEFWIYQDFFCKTPLDTRALLLWMPLPLRVLVWTWIHRRKNTAAFWKWPRKQETLRPCYVQWILYLASINNGGSKGSARETPPQKVGAPNLREILDPPL